MRGCLRGRCMSSLNVSRILKMLLAVLYGDNDQCWYLVVRPKTSGGVHTHTKHEQVLYA